MAQRDEYDPEMAISDEDIEMDSETEHDVENYEEPSADEDSETEVEGAVEEDYEESETSAAEARRGKDIQGIPWHTMNITRQKYRENRIKRYDSHRDVPQSEMGMIQLYKTCKKIQKGGNFYVFQNNTRSVKPTYAHFQLSNLVWATSKHDVYLSSDYSIIYWSALSRKGTEVLDVVGHIVASEFHQEAAIDGFRVVDITSMAAKDDLLVVGGYEGELICKYLGIEDVSYCSKITENGSSTNSIEIYQCPGGATRLLTSSNDCGVRVFDLSDGFARMHHFYFPWPVNHASVSPDNKLFLVVGDNVEGFLSDCQTGKNVATLQGHMDYSFASAWHPNGRVFATGNQDTTCRLWDIRNTSTSLEVLKGNMGAIRSIRFSSDGQFMAMAEQADFVHIYDAKNMSNKSQEIDFFGEITGISFSPDTESLFIGVQDETYGSLLEYNRRHDFFYLDSI